MPRKERYVSTPTRTTCRECGSTFVVRESGGGRPKWWCSDPCRDRAKARKPKRSLGGNRTYDAMRKEGWRP